MTVVATPAYIQASSHPADVFRRAILMMAHGQQGVRDYVAGDLLVSANGTPNMTVLVAAGMCAILGTQNTLYQGLYSGALNDASVALTIAAADATNPRIDIVVAQVEDASYSGSNNDWKLAVISGAPAASPSPPATPANAIVLAQVSVAANALSITSGNITDKRPTFGSLFHAEVYQAGAQSLNNGAGTIIAYDTILSDPNGNYTTGASAKYSPPLPGRYLVAAAVSAVLGMGRGIRARLNTVSAAGGVAVWSGGAIATAGDMVLASVTAVIRVTASGSSIDILADAVGWTGVSTTAGSDSTYASFTYLGPL